MPSAWLARASTGSLRYSGRAPGDRFRRAPYVRKNAKPCARYSTVSASRIARTPPAAPLCSTQARILARYRVLAEEGGTRERRDPLTHPPYQKPELLATAPNQLWSWDITKLHGPAKWNCFYLYGILDVFSRYVVGWMVAPGESAALATKLIEETYEKQNVPPGQLTIHAIVIFRGTSLLLAVH